MKYLLLLGCLWFNWVLAVTPAQIELLKTLDEQLVKITHIEASLPLEQTFHTRSKTAQFKIELITLQEKAEARQAKLAEDIAGVKELLSILKNNESENFEETDSVILAQIESLEAELNHYGAALKKVRLIKVQSANLLDKINSLNASTFSDFLFQKSPLILSLDALKNLSNEWRSTKDNLYSLETLITIIILLVVNALILIFGRRLYAFHFKLKLEDANFPRSYLYKIGIIISLIIIAYRSYYSLGTEETNPHLIGVIYFFCYASCSFLLFDLLRKLDIKPKKEIVDRKIVHHQRRLFKLTVYTAEFLSITVPILLILGYVILGAYITFNITITIAGLVLFFFLRSLAERAIHFFQIEKTKTLSALSIIVVELLLGVVILVLISSFWGFSLQNYSEFYEKFKNGFTIGQTNVNPRNILLTIIGFIATLYIFRFIQWFLKERVFKYTQTKRSVAEAMISLTGYLGIMVAIFTSLSILGLKSSDLTIVVGALSLGIGFGLQNIINNFVSGVILLFERPVKIGDWIVLDSGLQGTIKQISIRSTEIETIHRASVIIPNSDLISKSITNWTLRDPVIRLDLLVGVAYGSDVEKVREILLKAAAENEIVRKSPEPVVLFQDFADSSLNFELRYFVKGFTNQAPAQSELRFAINTALAEAGIEIPFPQRDIHIKSGKL